MLLIFIEVSYHKFNQAMLIAKAISALPQSTRPYAPANLPRFLNNSGWQIPVDEQPLQRLP
jgi:hypothetical protein